MSSAASGSAVGLLTIVVLWIFASTSLILLAIWVILEIWIRRLKEVIIAVAAEGIDPDSSTKDWRWAISFIIWALNIGAIGTFN